MSDAARPSVAELAEYCRTQAGLLSGRVQTIGEEADDLLDEIDDDIDAMRTRLPDTRSASTERPPTPDPGDDVEDLSELEAELDTKQALAEAKQARMAAFQDLAAGYVELAADLEAEDDWRAALEAVVSFERDTDAPTYFEERQTILETVASGRDDST